MKSKPIILIFTDSVALPRYGGALRWEQTYISKLKKEFSDYEIINISIGGATIKDLKNQVSYYKILSPEIVILQCGIVDAAPRAFGKIEKELIEKLHLFRFTKPFVKFLRRYRGHNYVSLKSYEKKLIELKANLSPQIFYTISVLPSCKAYEIKMPGITKNINKYNDVLKKHSQYIDLSLIPRDGILEDFHHINEIGHAYIFNLLKEDMQKRFELT